MFRTRALALALCLLAGAAQADNLALLGVGAGNPVAGYQGPGDIVASASAWYSCSRGYSAAYSTGSNNGCNLRRASDNTTQNIVILSNGNFDVASANAFAGTDASCTGSMVGTTTLTISACSSGTLHVNDTITGAGITQPMYITAIGTCAAPPGTCTVNAAQTFVSEALTAQVALFTTKAYDQIGTACTGGTACDMLQSTAGSQPQFLPSCNGGAPCLVIPANVGLLSTASVAPGIAQPYTQSTVVNTTLCGSCSLGSFISIGGGNPATGHVNSNNTWFLYAGTQRNFTMSDATWNSLQAIYNGASSSVSVNGTNTALATPGAHNFSGTVSLFGINGATYTTQEFGAWPVAFSSGQQTSVCQNQQAYYGSGNFGAAC